MYISSFLSVSCLFSATFWEKKILNPKRVRKAVNATPRSTDCLFSMPRGRVTPNRPIASKLALPLPLLPAELYRSHRLACQDLESGCTQTDKRPSAYSIKKQQESKKTAIRKPRRKGDSWDDFEQSNCVKISQTLRQERRILEDIWKRIVS